MNSAIFKAILHALHLNKILAKKKKNYITLVGLLLQKSVFILAFVWRAQQMN